MPKAFFRPIAYGRIAFSDRLMFGGTLLFCRFVTYKKVMHEKKFMPLRAFYSFICYN